MHRAGWVTVQALWLTIDVCACEGWGMRVLLLCAWHPVCRREAVLIDSGKIREI